MSRKVYDKKRKRSKGFRLLASAPPALYMMIILMILFSFFADHYFAWSNLSVILRQAAPLMMLACGQTLIILMQGTDLSLGSIVSLTSVLWIWLLNMGFGMPGSILLVILAGALCGLLNGLIVGKGLLPVFIVTLGTQNIFKSAALLLCGSQTIYYRHDLFRIVAKEGVSGISYSVMISFLMVGITWFLLNQTSFGMKIRGIGGNPEALTLAGVSISRTTIMGFIYAGIMAAVGGVLLCCRIESGNPNSGNGLEFSAVAAVLLGGTSMREGRGGVGGTIFGVLMLQVLRSGLTQVGVSSIYQNAIIGIVILTAIILDEIIRRRGGEED